MVQITFKTISKKLAPVVTETAPIWKLTRTKLLRLAHVFYFLTHSFFTAVLTTGVILMVSSSLFGTTYLSIGSQLKVYGPLTQLGVWVFCLFSEHLLALHAFLHMTVCIFVLSNTVVSTNYYYELLRFAQYWWIFCFPVFVFNVVVVPVLLNFKIDGDVGDLLTYHLASFVVFTEYLAVLYFGKSLFKPNFAYTEV